jgi:hypothetical protein
MLNPAAQKKSYATAWEKPRWVESFSRASKIIELWNRNRWHLRQEEYIVFEHQTQHTAREWERTINKNKMQALVRPSYGDEWENLLRKRNKMRASLHRPSIISVRESLLFAWSQCCSHWRDPYTLTCLLAGAAARPQIVVRSDVARTPIFHTTSVVFSTF